MRLLRRCGSNSERRPISCIITHTWSGFPHNGTSQTRTTQGGTSNRPSGLTNGRLSLSKTSPCKVTTSSKHHRGFCSDIREHSALLPPRMRALPSSSNRIVRFPKISNSGVVGALGGRGVAAAVTIVPNTIQPLGRRFLQEARARKGLLYQIRDPRAPSPLRDVLPSCDYPHQEMICSDCRG